MSDKDLQGDDMKASVKMTEFASSLLGTDFEADIHHILIGMIGNLLEKKGSISEADIIAEIEAMKKNIHTGKTNDKNAA